MTIGVVRWNIEEYIKANYGGHICAAYGCSLGGSFALVQYGNVHIDHAILGSSDLDPDIRRHEMQHEEFLSATRSNGQRKSETVVEAKNELDCFYH